VIAGSSAVVASMPWLKVFNKDLYAKSASDKVRLGIIGIGDRGKALLLNIQAFMEDANVEIAAVCDNYEPNYKRAVTLTGGKAKAFYDYRKLLEMKELDAVIIATPLHEHAHITLDAFSAGFHVFCEKAMARKIEDVKLMYDGHISSGKILQTGHQRMFSPVYLKAIEKIHKGELGVITHMRAYWHRNGDWRRPVPQGHPELDRKINWRLYDEYSAGLFTELLSHQVQVASWIKKSFPVSVIANGSINFWKKDREVYDDVACIFDYDDGAQCVFDSINSNRHYGIEEQIMGNKGTMELELNKFYSEKPPAPPAFSRLINDIEKDIFETIPIGGASWVPETAVKYKGEYIEENYKMDESKLQLEAFVRYIREGKAPEELSVQGYYSGIWVLLAEQAAKSRVRVELPKQYLV
jgi:predicted dehydrogenase